MTGQSRTIGKAVILARGLGRRMRAADQRAALDAGQVQYADAGLKAMIPTGRPFLDYVLSGLADAGYQHVCLVIGPEHEAVREYYTRTAPPCRVRVEFAIQTKPLGTANAVLAAEAFAGGEEFLVMNADNYYPVPVLEEVRMLGEPAVPLFQPKTLLAESNIPPERLRAFAFGRVCGGYLKELIEKPDDAALAQLGTDALVSMNAWRFARAVFDLCRATPLSLRGEYELPSAVNEGISNGRLRLKAIRAAAGVLDLSCRADVAEVAQRLRAVEPNP